MSTTHPSMISTMSQLQSSLRNFFMETGLLLKTESSALKGQKHGQWYAEASAALCEDLVDVLRK